MSDNSGSNCARNLKLLARLLPELYSTRSNYYYLLILVVVVVVVVVVGGGAAAAGAVVVVVVSWHLQFLFLIFKLQMLLMSFLSQFFIIECFFSSS